MDQSTIRKNRLLSRENLEFLEALERLVFGDGGAGAEQNPAQKAASRRTGADAAERPVTDFVADELAEQRESRRLSAVADGDSFDATPADALELAGQKIKDSGATSVLVIWEKPEGGLGTSHSNLTLERLIFLCERAKLDAMEDGS